MVAEQVQDAFNAIVDNALRPDSTATAVPLQTPFQRVQQPLRGRQLELSPRPAITNGGMGGKVLLMETALQKNTDLLAEAEKKILELQGEVALIKLHLRQELEENAKRQNVAQVNEQRLAVL